MQTGCEYVRYRISEQKKLYFAEEPLRSFPNQQGTLISFLVIILAPQAASHREAAFLRYAEDKAQKERYPVSERPRSNSALSSAPGFSCILRFFIRGLVFSNPSPLYNPKVAFYPFLGKSTYQRPDFNEKVSRGRLGWEPQNCNSFIV
jgi:hypothetical protein